MIVGSSNFLVPNSTFVVELVAFLIVVLVLWRYILPYITKPMEERQAVIRQALEDAEEAKRKATEAEAQYKLTLGEARTQARSVVDEANKLAEQLRTDRRAQAEQEYEQRLARAEADINARIRQATEELRQHAAELAITVAERVVGEGLDAQAHRGLIDRTIAEVEASSGGSN